MVAINKIYRKYSYIICKLEILTKYIIRKFHVRLHYQLAMYTEIGCKII
jgi:hypothetical protein